jgi:hypothetical protein
MLEEPAQSFDDGSSSGAVPPVETPEGERTVPVNVDEVFRELRYLKALGVAFFVLTGVAAILPGFLLQDSGSGPTALTLANIVTAVAGSAVGALGILVKGLRRVATFAGPALLLGAATVSPIGMSLDRIPELELILAFMYAVFWLLSVEYILALRRFSELGGHVVSQRLTNFDLGGVVNHFIVYGLGVVGIIASVTALVALFVPYAFSLGSNEVFNQSVELGSIWGVAIASAVVFCLSAMILTLARSVVPTKEDVESVAYSRAHMEDMLMGSRVIDLQRRGGRRKGDG